MKWLATIIAAVSALFNTNPQQIDIPIPLNTAIIAYTNTYYVPAVTDPGNFPYSKITKAETTKIKPTPPSTPIPTVVTPPPVVAPVETPVPKPVEPPIPPQDPYLANPEPIGFTWLSMNLSFKGMGSDGERTLPEISFDREYWKMEIFSYWAPVSVPKPPVEKDYFKLEVYDSETNKPVYTFLSGTNESPHVFQSFRKPGKYYIKTYPKLGAAFEISFFASPNLAK